MSAGGGIDTIGDLKTWVVTEHGDDSDVRHYRWDPVERKSTHVIGPRDPFDRVRASYTSLANAKKGLSVFLPARSTAPGPQAGLTACIWEIDFPTGAATLVFVRTSTDVQVKP